MNDLEKLEVYRMFVEGEDKAHIRIPCDMFGVKRLWYHATAEGFTLIVEGEHVYKLDKLFQQKLEELQV